MMTLLKLVHLVLAFAAAPLLLGIINRTKALFAGRKGQPLLQAYYDIGKLLRKGAVYSRSTSWLFAAGPWIGFAAVVAATALVPFGGLRAPVAFAGDFLVLAYLLGLARFLLVLSALDTGSSFEGMGASREVTFSALSEPALLIALAAVAKYTGCMSLSDMIVATVPRLWLDAGPVVVLVGFALLIVFLSENCRIPVDDPNTHLELTMIHEVMVLDHSGPDFGIILYTAALKMWVLGQVLVGLVVPIHTGIPWIDTPAALLAMALLAVLVGIIESSMARVRLLHVPQLLVGATTLSILAVVLVLR
ncbi:MAG TPA: NADH-quinone oxidoreductase subunit H [Sedimentisphaerales bacterium]|nr:NADH-quinone oxidoreductase subunit H [Sedimentisphaerales bacterium]HRS09807.1 NADH-quinone oxidoreductase subunit H [Sedimentisphaerales bacterium]HRV46543.1 NADH-quinone oxidoreductase subunit H [Sedimentisphaerales bacterium]